IECQRKEQNYNRIRNPLRQHRYGHRCPAHVIGKYLRHQSPENRANTGGKEHQVSQNQNKDEYPMELTSDDGFEEHQQRDRHAKRPGDVEWLAATPVDNPERKDGKNKICHPDNKGGEQRRIDLPARRFEDRWGVVDDRIDAGDVYQNSEEETNDYGAPY